MGENRDRVLNHCQPDRELGFTREEFDARLSAIRRRMTSDGIDLLWLMAPESLYYVSGYTCEWYQAQSPKQWPATSGIAVHVDHDKFILFDTPSEQVMCRFVTCARDIRTFPIDNRRDGIAFIMDELAAEGWLGGVVGMELHSYRPNPAISAQYEPGSVFKLITLAAALDIAFRDPVEHLLAGRFLIFARLLGAGVLGHENADEAGNEEKPFAQP